MAAQKESFRFLWKGVLSMQGKGKPMTIRQYTKAGELIGQDYALKPTKEMQELLDYLWSRVESTTTSSKPNKKHQVEISAR